MSELPNSNNELLHMQHSIALATEAFSGEPNQDPLEIFADYNPALKERREDVEFNADLTPEQETNFRTAMSELGVGREDNVGAFSAGLQPGYVAVLEGGQAHKMMAELDVVLEDEIRPSAIVVVASGFRELPETERDLTSKLLGIDSSQVGKTEYDVAIQVVEHANAQGDTEPSVVLTTNLGATDAVVRFVEVKKLDHPTDPDPKKYIPSLNNQQKIQLGLDIGKNIAGGQARDVAFVTSGTYKPSCEIAARDAVNAEEEPAFVKVLTYGTEQLAKVKGEEPKQPALKQLAGEAYKTAKMLAEAQQ